MRLNGYLQILTAAMMLALPASAQRNRAAAEPNPNPFAGNADAIAEGREVYNNICTACHGKDGEAGDRALALGAPARRYERSTDAQIFDAIQNGIPGTHDAGQPLARGQCLESDGLHSRSARHCHRHSRQRRRRTRAKRFSRARASASTAT